MTSMRTSRRALAALAAATTAAAGFGLATAPGASAATGDDIALLTAEPLRDLQPDDRGPFDRAHAVLAMGSWDGKTAAGLALYGVGSAARGKDYGVHLHVGPCVAGDGDAAGPHYNASTEDPPVVNNRTEIWLDTTISSGGTGAAWTYVPFVPEAGERSIVVHEKPTSSDGTAGDRLACLPVTIR